MSFGEPIILKRRALPFIVSAGLLGLLLVLALAIGHPPAMIVMVVAVAAPLGLLAFANGRRTLTLDADGITDTGMLSPTSIPWAEVDHYTFLSMGQQYAGAAAGGGLLGMLIVSAVARAMERGEPNRRFRLGTLAIRARDGKVIKLRPQWADIGIALDRVFAELHPRLAAPAPDRFAPLELTATGIVHRKKGELAFPDIDKVMVHNGVIRLHKRGKRFSWFTISMRKLKNSMLFLEQLAERGIVVNTAAEVFVPDAVMAKLSAANTRAAAFPRASVVQR